MAEPVPVIRKLEHALADDDFAWSLLLVGEDQTDKLVTLTSDLRGPFSTSGNGKQITSGFSYWGIGPTIAWANATNDPFYLVMKAGTESFLRHWRKIRPHVEKGGFHLVSLGVGTGVKDRTILTDLRRHNRDMYYIPVDMSSEMLRMGPLEPVQAGFPRSQVLPVQLDFSIADNMDELGEMLARLVGAEPLLFTLTGNTLANFDNDEELLGTLTRVLRPQDRLLLEVASTTRLDQETADAAADEYHQTRAFAEFVTSTLRYNTDLKISNDLVKFVGEVEDDDALLVKILWQNDTGEEVRMELPDHTEVVLPIGDTIRLYTTRKYSADRLKRLTEACKLTPVEAIQSQFRYTRRPNPFGLELLLLAPEAAGEEAHTLADDIWST
ncbi:L-histidine N(alpha)-methyltransferase [Kribbella solani]|uniref:Putative SAM-dependent methyltransferase n=1 Tax=Kribbella solani TaxID=236067 RepID=A0A841E022_9ACTN|nr:L-histidine N(alpha)-methyltransferase [Kribbella solani]MBB5980788.1 putative SAM-dependent methyltransferase [Kribbella solani]MDX2967533.1 L-histidine N(alpha)-methyltransferase [Kribbella solani]MDX3002465.1 L-histidine N(alpha)-methyltransferase [Kribbella solani]